MKRISYLALLILLLASCATPHDYTLQPGQKFGAPRLITGFSAPTQAGLLYRSFTASNPTPGNFATNPPNQYDAKINTRAATQ